MWTYSDWRSQSTVALQIARLKLHIQEVADKVGSSTSANGYSVDRRTNLDYYKMLQDELKGLEAAGGGVNGGVSLATFVD